jgi:hypothetical protein
MAGAADMAQWSVINSAACEHLPIRLIWTRRWATRSITIFEHCGGPCMSHILTGGWTDWGHTDVVRIST